jgi:hypothetical protein
VKTEKKNNGTIAFHFRQVLLYYKQEGAQNRTLRNPAYYLFPARGCFLILFNYTYIDIFQLIINESLAFLVYCFEQDFWDVHKPKFTYQTADDISTNITTVFGDEGKRSLCTFIFSYQYSYLCTFEMHAPKNLISSPTNKMVLPRATKSHSRHGLHPT